MNARARRRPAQNNVFYYLAFFLVPFNAIAQGYHWEVLNMYPGGTGRFDDTYFFSRDTGFAAAQDGKLYKTYGGGDIWHTRLTVTPAATIRSIEFSDNRQYGVAGALNGKIFSSTDAGETWTEITSSVPDTGIFRNRICGVTHYGNTDFYAVGWWAGNVARFFRSTDGGQNWQVNFLDTNIATCLIDIVAQDAQTLFACGGKFINGKRHSVVIKSTDAGNSWATVFIDSVFGGRIWKLQFLDNSLGYGAVEPYYYPDTVCIIKTTDGGQNWNVINIGKSQNSFAIGTQTVGFITPKVGWVGGWYQGLFETTDSGKTWSYQTPPEAYNMNRIFRLNDTLAYATTGSGLMRYVPGWKTAIGQSRNYTNTVSHTLYPVTPNPSNGRIKIEFDINHATNMALEVIDVNGKRFERIMAGYLQPGHYTRFWEGTDKPAGTYMVWMGTDEIPLVQKFILN